MEKLRKEEISQLSKYKKLKNKKMIKNVVKNKNKWYYYKADHWAIREDD